MRINQFAQLTNLSAKTIRYYEDIGLLPPAHRLANGYRDYDDTDVDKARFVAGARSLDFSLDDIQEILALREQREAPCRVVLDLLQERADEIKRRVLAGAGDDWVYGGLGADQIEGGTGADVIYGDDGDDIISGDGGDDVVYGGAGEDHIAGAKSHEFGDIADDVRHTEQHLSRVGVLNDLAAYYALDGKLRRVEVGLQPWTERG